jgi:hypothetical protein
MVTNSAEATRQSLRHAVTLLRAQGHTQAFALDLLREVWREAGEVRSGSRSKLDEAMPLIRTFLEACAGKTTKGAVQRHLQTSLNIPRTTARRYLQFFLLWECKSAGRLTAQNRRWLKRYVPGKWNPYEKRCREWEKIQATMRTAIRLVTRTTSSPTSPTTKSSQNLSRRAFRGPYVTREELFELLGLT